jgi:hypothetical protein
MLRGSPAAFLTALDPPISYIVKKKQAENWTEAAHQNMHIKYTENR